MAINIETAINHMYAMKNAGVRYSMKGSRIGIDIPELGLKGDNTADCSGSIYASLRKAGAKAHDHVVSTESMHGWLLNNDFELIAFNKSWSMKRGDIVILGLKGQSAGANGHVFMAVDGTNGIHCTWKSASANGVYVDNENIQPYSWGFYVYRLKTSASTSKPSTSTPSPSKPSTGVKWYSEKGTYVLGQNTNIREGASTKDRVIAMLPKGSVVKYDQFCHSGGYVWIRQQRGGGKYGYIATGMSDGKKRTSYWGTFK